MKVAGIDCGVEGSAALLDTDLPGEVRFYDIPLNSDRELDAHALFTVLLDFGTEAVCTEFTFKQPKLQQMTGEIKAIAKILQADLEVVSVARWKKAMLGYNTSDKEVSKSKALELYPNAEFIKPRCRTVSADRCEAALLGAFYIRTYLKRNP